MNSREWDLRGFKKYRNPSGEVIRTKTYERILVAWDTHSAREIVSARKKLAELLGVPWYELLANLEVTVKINRYRRHRRFLKFFSYK